VICAKYAGTRYKTSLNQPNRRVRSSMFSHNPKVGGSNPPPATNGIIKLGEPEHRLPFLMCSKCVCSLLDGCPFRHRDHLGLLRLLPLAPLALYRALLCSLLFLAE